MPAEDHAVRVIYSEVMLIALTEEEDEEEDGEVSAQATYNWVAYNDCAWVQGKPRQILQNTPSLQAVPPDY
jgi:hypothetical protein